MVNIRKAKLQKQIKLPYSKQHIDNSDIIAVVNALTSGMITTGPLVERFENAMAEYCGVNYAVAMNSGTAALHAAMRCVGVQRGDEVITSPMSFMASANCAVYEGATPIFADICEDTFLIDPASVKQRITKQTKAIVAVDYAGQPADYAELNTLNLPVIADAAHSLGGGIVNYGAGENNIKYLRKVGSLANMTCLSFHPVKTITTCEGGMLLTDNIEYAAIARKFRNHGMTNTPNQRNENKIYSYDMLDMGYNYRLNDVQCALGLSQLQRAEDFVHERNLARNLYLKLIEEKNIDVVPLKVSSHNLSACHLFVVKLPDYVSRIELFKYMHDRGIGVNVHYIPTYQLEHYRRNYARPHCPVTEKVATQHLSLPLFPGITAKDIIAVLGILDNYMARKNPHRVQTPPAQEPLSP